jgi:EAL domain-containing protein (putative c-di-GMP-specific phosphodiesterase class I)
VARLSSPNATEGLFLDMKPIVAVAAPGASLNLDVLLRMRAPDGSIVVAAPIIAAAEKSGRAGVIDRWVLGTALEWIERHAAALPNVQFVSIKVSGAALNDEHFVQDLLALLQRHGTAARRLCVALSERVALQDLDNTRRFIDLVRAYGVKVALDEFGALHTSFSYLKQLHADFLKIDPTFSADLHAHPANPAIVEAIVHLAKKLGMKTIAPGVHDTATVRALAGIGVDYVQGEGVARPQPLDAILAAQSSACFVNGDQLPELAVPAEAAQQEQEQGPVQPVAQL